MALILMATWLCYFAFGFFVTVTFWWIISGNAKQWRKNKTFCFFISAIIATPVPIFIFLRLTNSL